MLTTLIEDLEYINTLEMPTEEALKYYSSMTGVRVPVLKQIWQTYQDGK